MSLQRLSAQITVLVFLFLVHGCATMERDIPDRYSADELRGMGEKFLIAEDYNQALKFFHWAKDKNPNDPLTHYDLGITYDELSMSTEALHHLNRAIELSPNYSDAYNALGRHYAREGDLDQAQVNFEKALSNPLYETSHLALFNLGLLFEKRGDPGMALQYYEEATRRFPRYGLAYYRMGKILEAHRMGDEARLAYGKAVEYAPNMPEAHLRYGVMCYLVGELENAFYSLDRVLRLAPNTIMAQEARSYLSHINTVLDTGTGSRPVTTHRDPLTRVEVMRDRDLSTSPSAQVHSHAHGRPSTPSVSEPQVRETPTAPPTQAAIPEGAHQEMVSQKWAYIVQVGSYLHRPNAERLARNLESKGYEATVKEFAHKVLGNLHVVQLKPVGNRSQALELVKSIEKDGMGEAIVIRMSIQ